MYTNNYEIIISILAQVGSEILRVLPIILLFIYVLRQKSQSKLFKAARVYIIVQFAVMVIWTLVQGAFRFGMMNRNDYVIAFDIQPLIFQSVGAITTVGNIIALIMLLIAIGREDRTEADYV